MDKTKLALVTTLIGAVVGALLMQQWVRKNQTEQSEKIISRTDVVTRIIERPNGDKETVIVDRSVTKSEAKLIVPKPSLLVAATAQLVDKQAVYGIQVSKQVMGPVTVGASLDQKGHAGILVGWAF